MVFSPLILPIAHLLCINRMFNNWDYETEGEFLLTLISWLACFPEIAASDTNIKAPILSRCVHCNHLKYYAVSSEPF